MALEMLPMDLSSTVIGSVVSVAVVLISYVIYKFGIAEKSFEEVIEEQKRRSLEEELRLKSEKVKKEKKFKKTWKKSKERLEPEIPLDSIQITEIKDIDIEIIEQKEIKSLKQKKPKSTANQQSAEEKVKKVDASPINEKYSVEKKKTEVEKVKIEPQIFELPKPVEIKDAQPLPVSMAQTTSQSAVTSNKKKKKEHLEKDVTPMTASKLLSFIKDSALEAEEIQNLIDILLNKQKDTAGWTKRNDSLAVTKKNLHEKEQLLDQELRQNQAVTSKLKDLREDYNALKAKSAAQEKSSVEKINRLQHDVQSLTTKTKQMQDHLAAEKEKIAQIEKEKEMKIQAGVKHLEEEKTKLLHKIFKLETESCSGISKIDYDTVKKAREELQKVHNLLIEQHTQLVLKDKNQVTLLSDIKSQVDKLNSQNRVLSDECKTLKDSLSSMELAKRTAEDQLRVEEKHSADFEVQIKQLSSQIIDSKKLQTELSDLRLENERLVTTKERVAGDGQEIFHQNGEINGKTQELPEKLFSEKEKLLEEKEFMLVQLNDDLNKEKVKVSLLGEEIEVQKQKNNELREKNWKAVEALKNAEQKMQELQTSADQKFLQLEKENKSSDIADRLEKAEREVVQRLSDYNKELEKNKQLSTEIVKLKEFHKFCIDEAQKKIEELKSNIEKCHTETEECLQRICPDTSVNISMPFEKMLLEFEKQVKTINQNARSSDDFKVLLQQKESEYLQKQTHYEQVLAETESTLLELQKTAESQEVVWQERLKVKEVEFEQVKLERDALAHEKEAMQSTFQQLTQLEELQEKLKLLQSTLETAENERSHIELKYDEVQKNCLNLSDQLDNKEMEIMELQKNSNSLESLNKEIEDLKTKLEKERKINKDFSSQMNRLNSLVKIGQDAVKEEQEMVKNLKAQLEAAQVSTANGSANTTTSPVTLHEAALDKK